MEQTYDVIIVGAGPAGIFTAYELAKKAKGLKVLLVDKGLAIHHRECLILKQKRTKCPEKSDGISGCHPACSITSGFGGAGAYSDGKFNITSEFGGWLGDYLDKDTVEALIGYVDEINLSHGASESLTDPTTEAVKAIEKRALGKGLKLLRAKVRHLGTEENIGILKRIYEHMKDDVDMLYAHEVKDVIVTDDRVSGIVCEHKKEGLKKFFSKNVVLAPGRDGASFLSALCKKLRIPQHSNQVDIGVRVETNDEIMEEINRHLYEGKFIFHTSVGTMVRTFCSNPSGHVVIENHSGTMIANGHAYKDKSKGSKNTNFALLVSHSFEEPFTKPNEFAHKVSHLANMLSGGSIIVQRYGDLLKGSATSAQKLRTGFVTPTLKEAVPGDLGLALPYNTMKSLIEMIEALDTVTPGIASEHTLFYGVEAKFYSARPELSETFESTIGGLYFAGDGAGITRGLAQAGANGIHIARSLLKKAGVLS